MKMRLLSWQKRCCTELDFQMGELTGNRSIFLTFISPRRHEEKQITSCLRGEYINGLNTVKTLIVFYGIELIAGISC
jgi:hypothetical protein